MYALQKRIVVTLSEWEVKNEIKLNQLRETGLSVLGFLIFLMWKVSRCAVGLLQAALYHPRLVRKVGPGLPNEELQDVRRLYEQGPLVR